MSPVNGRLFAATKSMQNIQFLTNSNGVNTYLCKYIGKIDENNHVIVRCNTHDPGNLISRSTFLHNMKSTTSAMNEMKVLSKKHGNKGPMGRAISLMEMTQVMLNYPQIYTDMVFVNVPTIPLELRAGVERNINRRNKDADEVVPFCFKIREKKVSKMASTQFQ